MSFAIIPSGKKPVALIYKLIPVIIMLIGIAVMLFARISNDETMDLLSTKPQKGVVVLNSITKKPELTRISYTVYDEEFDVTYNLKRDFDKGEIRAIEEAQEGDSLKIKYSYTNEMRIEDANVVFVAIAEGYYTLIYIGIGVIALGLLYAVLVVTASCRFAKHGYNSKAKTNK